MTRRNLTKRTNTVMVRNAAPRILALTQQAPIDYRAMAVALSSAPLDGKIAELKIERERQERLQGRTRIGREYLPRFDDIRW